MTTPTPTPNELPTVLGVGSLPPEAIEAAVTAMEAHHIELGKSNPDNTGSCICGEWIDGDFDSWDEHLLNVLIAHGWMPAAQAKAEALREAALAMDNIAVNTLVTSRSGVSSTWGNAADWLRASAATIEGETP